MKCEQDIAPLAKHCAVVIVILHNISPAEQYHVRRESVNNRMEALFFTPNLYRREAAEWREL
jgi:hypothetical protein